VREAAERRVLDRRARRIPGIDLDDPAVPVGLVAVVFARACTRDGDVEASVRVGIVWRRRRFAIGHVPAVADAPWTDAVASKLATHRRARRRLRFGVRIGVAPLGRRRATTCDATGGASGASRATAWPATSGAATARPRAGFSACGCPPPTGRLRLRQAGGKVAGPVLLTGQVRVPWRVAVRAVVERPSGTRAVGAVLRYDERRAAHGAADFHRRLRGDAPVVPARHDLPFPAGLPADLGDRHAVRGDALAHLIGRTDAAAHPYLLGHHLGAVDVLVIDAEQTVVVRIVGEREVVHPVVMRADPLLHVGAAARFIRAHPGGFRVADSGAGNRCTGDEERARRVPGSDNDLVAVVDGNRLEPEGRRRRRQAAAHLAWRRQGAADRHHRGEEAGHGRLQPSAHQPPARVAPVDDGPEGRLRGPCRGRFVALLDGYVCEGIL
jgi:hypothetical protein